MSSLERAEMFGKVIWRNSQKVRRLGERPALVHMSVASLFFRYCTSHATCRRGGGGNSVGNDSLVKNSIVKRRTAGDFTCHPSSKQKDCFHKKSIFLVHLQ